MKREALVLGTVLLLGGCGHAAQQSDRLKMTMPAATADPEMSSLRAQLARMRAERDAAVARLHALTRRKPAVVRVFVREPAAAPAASNDSGQATQVFSNETTAASP
jgi:hypothetical protein